MYTSFQLAKKYLYYYLTASNGKGHGIHSPFVFDFIKFVLNDKKKYACYEMIEAIRRKLSRNKSVIEVEDFGAGSAVIKTSDRVVSKVAASSLKSKKFAQLLFRIVQHYEPKTMLELGTSFGTTTAYLAKGNEDAKVFTLEGAASIAGIANLQFELLHITNIQLLEGDFKHTLPQLLKNVHKIDLAFIDGNHTKAATLDYFKQLLDHATESSIFIFDDIHWSADMEEAWKIIQQHPSVTLTIDLFFIGLVFINPAFTSKQQFRIRF